MATINESSQNLFYSILVYLQRLNSVVVPAMILIAPKTAIGGLCISGLLGLPEFMPRFSQIIKSFKTDPLFIFLTGFILYLLCNATIAVDSEVSFLKVITFIIIASIAFLTPYYVLDVPKQHLSQFTRGFVIGVLLGISWLLIEVPLGSPITSQIIQVFPYVDDENLRWAIREEGKIIGFQTLMLNKSIGALVLLFWPAVLSLFLWPNNQQGYAVSTIFLITALFLIFKSDNQTSMIAFVLSLFVLCFVHFVPRLSYYLVLAVWCASMLLAVPIAKMPFSLGIQNAQWLPISARDRLYIWNYTAKKVADNPIFGVGVRGTRYLEENAQDGLTVKEPGSIDENLLTPRLGQHAHNMFLQTWFELGAIGALFLTAIGVIIIVRLRRLPSLVKPFGYALFTSSVTLGAFGWGMWKTWLLATIAVAFTFFMICKQFEGVLSQERSARSS